MTDDLLIREFLPGDEAAFRRLNQEWIDHYFRMEPKDEAILSDPHGQILQGGGRLLLAFRDGEAIGCCALIAIGPGEFELSKMAVAATARGTGVGRRVLEAVIDLASSLGATRLSLETNHVLAPAIRLYESCGFRHLPPDRIPHSEYARADVYMELLLEQTRTATQ